MVTDQTTDKTANPYEQSRRNGMSAIRTLSTKINAIARSIEELDLAAQQAIAVRGADTQNNLAAAEARLNSLVNEGV